QFCSRLAAERGRAAVQRLHVEAERGVHAARLRVRAAAATAQDAPFLFQQQQGTTHGRPRYSIAGDEIRLARQRARGLVLTVSQRLRQDAIELQIAGDARIRGAGENASTTTHVHVAKYAEAWV